MKVVAHILAFNEAELIAYTMRHYRSFCTSIYVHDGGSTDGTQDICRRYGAEVKHWDTKGQLNDELSMKCKNECWLGTDADWVLCPDADEFIYFPQGAEATLKIYSRLGAAVIKPRGYDMFSEAYPTTTGQIYDEVKTGTLSDKWYAKPILFSPHKIMESGFGIGAHESEPVLHNGSRLHVGSNWPKATPPTYLLHFHHGIGPIERIARRLDEKRERLATCNKQHGWGNFKEGRIHAAEKQEFIKAGLHQVIL